MNLIKALEGLSIKPEADKAEQTRAPAPPPSPAPPEQKTEVPNVMASVIERHEQISNRVRTKSKPVP